MAKFYCSSIIFYYLLITNSLSKCHSSIKCPYSKNCSCIGHTLDCSRLRLNNFDQVFDVPIRQNVSARFSALNFSSNNLTELPVKFIGAFRAAEVLDLSLNEVHLLMDRNFINNGKLKVLNVASNQLIQIRHQMFVGLNSLRELNLSSNLLIDLKSDEFKTLKSLVVLDLSRNMFSALGGGLFRYLNKLTTLILDDCGIDYMSVSTLAGLLNLRILSLKHNKIKTLPSFSYTPVLNKLFLDDNNIEILDSTNFRSASQLEEISLKDLKSLKVVSTCTFCGLHNLKRLVLCQNPNLTEIASCDGSWRPDYMELLDLSNNNLTLLPPNFIYNWTSVGEILLSGNRWKCDCQMSWMLGVREYILDDPRCHSPDELFNVSILKLNVEIFSRKCSPTSTTKPKSQIPKILASIFTAAFFVCILSIIYFSYCKKRSEKSEFNAASKRKTKKVCVSYAYQNLSMMDEKNDSQFVAQSGQNSDNAPTIDRQPSRSENGDGVLTSTMCLQ